MAYCHASVVHIQNNRKLERNSDQVRHMPDAAKAAHHTQPALKTLLIPCRLLGLLCSHNSHACCTCCRFYGPDLVATADGGSQVAQGYVNGMNAAYQKHGTGVSFAIKVSSSIASKA
jgi:hypothetical protein